MRPDQPEPLRAAEVSQISTSAAMPEDLNGSRAVESLSKMDFVISETCVFSLHMNIQENASKLRDTEVSNGRVMAVLGTCLTSCAARYCE